MTILLKAANLWVHETSLPENTSVSLHAILSKVDDVVSDLLLDCILCLFVTTKQATIETSNLVSYNA